MDTHKNAPLTPKGREAMVRDRRRPDEGRRSDDQQDERQSRSDAISMIRPPGVCRLCAQRKFAAGVRGRNIN